MEDTAERQRLESYRTEHSKWKKWGPYVSERAWATVREDYSLDGDAWNYFPYEQARTRAYRWNEDGLGGFCDRNQRICIALALWNGKDSHLKERLFGLTNPEGNHAEDVKEYYFYLDNTPTHSYQRMLYKYPQEAFPYAQLIEENRKRGLNDPEYELLDTGIFDENRYFDVFIEYAKASEEDILIRYTLFNRGRESASCHILPTIWFRNTWSWGYSDKGSAGNEGGKPILRKQDDHMVIEHPIEGVYTLYVEGDPEWLFTENETPAKEGFHRYVVRGEKDAVNSKQEGTKGAALLSLAFAPEGKKEVRLRFTKSPLSQPFSDFDLIFKQRQEEADAFYAAIHPPKLKAELKKIQRLAFAGLLWNKQFYYFDLEQWMRGDPLSPRKQEIKRDKDWAHLFSFDILSMPDKWEYPYFCSWDMSFHCIPMLLLDPDYAKRQIELLTREWYLHPNGQLPSCEWNFSDVNPPVLAWCAWRAYKIDGKTRGAFDRDFLKAIYNKLLLNFTWWVNREDVDGNNIFQGGFLGLDNISVFDRSTPLPSGGHIDQSDATAWMAFYCTVMMKIALYLSLEEPYYQDIATKFFEHFLRIAQAMSHSHGHSLWDPSDGFFYDTLHLPNESVQRLKIRSLVGLLPLLAVETLEPHTMEKLPIFSRRVEWFISKRPHVSCNLAAVLHPGQQQRRLLSLVTEEQLKSVLKYMLDETEFLSDYGIRSLSKYHRDHVFNLSLNNHSASVRYLPAESDSRMFGGNSNWRGPIWFPINFLLIESLQKFHYYYGDTLKVEFPTGSGQELNLADVAKELSKRLIRLFVPDEEGRRPTYGKKDKFKNDPHWKDLVLFNEYFHGDTGFGLGASHQTGWTALVAKLIQQSGEDL